MLIKFCDFCNQKHIDKLHADFSFGRMHDVIYILDHNEGNRSLTNDIEYALWSINKEYQRLFFIERFKLKNTKVIYRDSEGYFDEVVLDDKGCFKAFRSLGGVKSIDEAVIALDFKQGSKAL